MKKSNIAQLRGLAQTPIPACLSDFLNADVDVAVLAYMPLSPDSGAIIIFI
jgi:hypothetical protein